MSILCLSDFHNNVLKEANTFKKMYELQKHDDSSTIYVQMPHLLMAQDHTSGLIEHHGNRYSIVLNGTIFNKNEVRKKLENEGYLLTSDSVQEIILVSYIAYKEKCLDLFEGQFAFVIYDNDKLFIARDPLGIKPLYYYFKNNTLIVSSEIKSILFYLQEAVIDKRGIKELLGLGPSLTPGLTLYKDIYMLRAGHYAFFQNHLRIQRYFYLIDQEHTDSLQATIEHTRQLVKESIEMQIEDDKPICTMLSGGLDSSIITAISALNCNHLTTYSLTYEDQEKYFQSNDYQTTMDDQYIKDLVKEYQTEHHLMTLTQEELVHSLKASLIARDMPGMADIDSSFLLFCEGVASHDQICLSGECADEIFGGYPWFYKKELYEQPYFPWMRELDKKLELFHPDLKDLNIKDYIIQRYQETLNEIKTDDFKKQMLYLNLEWFMQTLLIRADSQSLPSHLELRVPFASKKIVQYLYNMPISYMFYNGEEKGILRAAFKHYLPHSITHRKKNPFPKTQSPLYRELVVQLLKDSLDDPDNLLFKLFDHDHLIELINSKGASFQYPWYGQLMMGPQLLAYLYQIYLWGNIYHIRIE